jgi:hypothetical protein
MDKLTLTKEQLKELKKFINSRGFREPLIVMEILDHFACLVEEKLEANPGMPLDEAMQQAHGSFGVMGFRTIADAADVERNKRLNKQFKKTLGGMVASPAMWLLFVLVGAIYYTTYMSFQEFFVDGDNAGFLTAFPALLIVVIGQTIIFRRFPGIKNRYVSGKGTLADNGYYWLVFILMIFFPNYPGGDWPLMPFAIAATIYILAILTWVIAMYRTWQSTEQHYRDIEQMYAELDTQ